MLKFYIAFFSLWFLASILWQFDKTRKLSGLLRKANVLNILPIWTFFAPKPGVKDTHLLYRDKCVDGSLSDWVEIPVFERRRFYHFIWNPNKRINKLIVDSISQVKTLKRLGMEDKDKNDEEVLQMVIKTSKGYLILLNTVVQYPKIRANSKSRQFIIADTDYLGGTRSLTPILSSPFHML